MTALRLEMLVSAKARWTVPFKESGIRSHIFKTEYICDPVTILAACC